MDLGSIAVPFLVAAVLGAAVGFQREATHKPAGLRTHLIVAVSTCGLGLLAHLAGDDRIAQGVVTGVGFIGAGAIVRVGSRPRNLTTAGTLWSAAAIGIIAGLGGRAAFPIAGATAVLTLLALAVSDHVIARLLPHEATPVRISYDLALTDHVRVHAAASALLGRVSPGVKIDVDALHGERVIATVTFHVVTPPGTSLVGPLERLAREPGIAGIDVSEHEADAPA